MRKRCVQRRQMQLTPLSSMKHISTILLHFLLLSSTPALAQSKATPPPPKSQSDPDDLYREGKAALKAQDYEKAQRLLSQSFKRKPTWKCAADLGMAELALQHFPEAAKHFEFFLTHADKSSVGPDIWQRFVDYFKQATDNSLTLDISVNEPNAEVFMDGNPIGISPIKTVIFTTPGKHVFNARKAGFIEARTTINSKAGDHSKVNLLLNALAAEPPSNNAIPAWWNPTFIGASAASLGLAVGFTVAANDLSSIIVSDTRELKNAQKTIPIGQSVCGANDYKKKCELMVSRGFRWDVYQSIAIADYAATGVFAFAAVAPYILPHHWFPWNKAKPSPNSSRIFSVVSPKYVGIVHETSF